MQTIDDTLVKGFNEEIRPKDHVQDEFDIRINLEKEVDELKLKIEKLKSKNESAEITGPLIREIILEVSYINLKVLNFYHFAFLIS